LSAARLTAYFATSFVFLTSRASWDFLAIVSKFACFLRSFGREKRKTFSLALSRLEVKIKPPRSYLEIISVLRSRQR
jgi:hypothetical protein